MNNTAYVNLTNKTLVLPDENGLYSAKSVKIEPTHSHRGWGEDFVSIADSKTVQANVYGAYVRFERSAMKFEPLPDPIDGNIFVVTSDVYNHTPLNYRNDIVWVHAAYMTGERREKFSNSLCVKSFKQSIFDISLKDPADVNSGGYINLTDVNLQFPDGSLLPRAHVHQVVEDGGKTAQTHVGKLSVKIRNANPNDNVPPALDGVKFIVPKEVAIAYSKLRQDLVYVTGHHGHDVNVIIVQDVVEFK